MTRLAALLGFALATVAEAQGPPVTVRGIAYDSLRGEPLGGALIAVVGTGRTSLSDRRGRFEIDSVRPGTHTFTLNHDAIDSLGLSGVSVRVEVTNGRAEVRLAVPSFAAFWRTGCARTPPRDSILVYGAVRRPGGQVALANAKVELAWIDLGVKGKKEITQQSQTLSAMTDSTGAYGFCGVPAGAALRIRASSATAASGIIDLAPSADRVRWRDLTIGPLLGLDSTQVGMVSGVVTRGAGVPLADARVVVDDVGEVRTDAAGRFAVRNVPAGTRQLQVLAVGQDPVSRVVDVTVNENTELAVTTDKVTTLSAARVTGSAFTRRFTAGIDERRIQGLGTFIDSAGLVGRMTMARVFDGIPSAYTGRNPRQPVLTLRDCSPAIFIDGVDQRGQEPLWALYPDQIALVEVYKIKGTIPTEFHSTRRADCAVIVWTKRALGR